MARKIITQWITATATLDETNDPVPGEGVGTGNDPSFPAQCLSLADDTSFTGTTPITNQGDTQVRDIALAIDLPQFRIPTTQSAARFVSRTTCGRT